MKFTSVWEGEDSLEVIVSIDDVNDSYSNADAVQFYKSSILVCFVDTSFAGIYCKCTVFFNLVSGFCHITPVFVQEAITDQNMLHIQLRTQQNVKFSG